MTFDFEGWTIETTDSVLIEVLTAVERAKAVITAYETLPYNEVKDDAYDELSRLMDATYYDPKYKAYGEIIRDMYWALDSASSDAYRRRYEREFLEFERKNVDYENGLWIGSEDDYGFYSDWSKDIYGRRKRWCVASRL